MRYSHFTQDDRNELSVLLNKGYSLRDISKILRKDPSSVSREVNGNSVNGKYDPRKAQHKAYVKRRRSKYQAMKIRMNSDLEQCIIEQLTNGWTPEEISGRLKEENNEQPVICFKSIYKWLGTVYGERWRKYLASKQAKWRRRKKGKKVIIKNRIFIDNRPEIINQRQRLGDFEGDVLGSTKRESERLVGAVDRKARYFVLKKVNRLKETIPTLDHMLKTNNALSCTLDNGPENASHQKLELPVFFCHPYSAWEKPTIENTFQRLRRYISKKDKLSQYSQDDISIIADKMNNTPRKCLNWKTPKEVFFNRAMQPLLIQFNFPTTKCCASG